jgi:hypothetical protein
MTPDFFVYLAEIRVLELESTRSYAQYFKYYNSIYPANTATVFDKQRQYFKAYSNFVYLDILDNTKKIANPNGINMPVTRCDYSKIIKMTPDA